MNFVFLLNLSHFLKQLGVNGYAFMMTNNGKVLFHPDFRPIVTTSYLSNTYNKSIIILLQFQDISAIQDLLKPYYSSVDLTEVELGNITQDSRVFLKLLRSSNKNFI